MGRIPGNLSRENMIEHLWDHHKEIMRMLLLGMRPEEIGEKLGISPTHISVIRNSDVFKDQLAVLQAQRDASAVDVAREIAELAPEAIKRIREVISRPIDQSPDERLTISASQDILDRAGFTAVRRFQGALAHLTAEDLAEMKRRAVESGIVVEEKGDEEK